MPQLLLVFLIVPILELIVLVQVSRVIGWGWTLVALFGVSIAGAVLVKREGGRAWTRFREAIAAGRVPAEEVVDGALVLAAGAFLLTPGYLTDVVGLLLLVPPSRRLVNQGLRTRVRASFGLGPARSRRGGARPERGADDPVDVEVVRVERDEQDDPGPDRHPPGGPGAP